MSSIPQIDDALRARLLTEPTVILDDPDLMRALIAAHERAMGDNIVDMRGIAMDRLEARLDRLDETHRAVIAAAYENLAGTQQVHRAILHLLEATTMDGCIGDLEGEVAAILRVDAMRLLIEGDGDGAAGAGAAPRLVAPGFVRGYLTGGRDVPPRQVTLRRVELGDGTVYGAAAPKIRSEACLLLEFGGDRRPGMLVMGSNDPQQFTPQQGCDLLAFFAGVVERVLRRWLP